MPIDTPGLRLAWPDQASDIDLAPLDGLWTEALYLKISEQTNQLIEFTDGTLEVLPMSTGRHQVILALLYELFVATIRPRGGKVLFAPLRLQTRPGKFREPDLVVLLNKDDPRNENAYWLGADLVVEVASRDDPDRDIVTKRADYGEAGISAYWIVNPLDETISVLTLQDNVYVEHGIFLRGERAKSKLIERLTVSVDEVFDAQ